MQKVTITTPVVLPDPGVVSFTLTGLPSELHQCQLEIRIARVELLRDHLAAWRSGPAEAVAGELAANIELISPVKSGLHSLSLVRVRSPDGSQEVAGPEGILGLPAYFRVSSDLATGPVTEADLHSAGRAREEAIQSEMVTPAANGANSLVYSVHIFCAATLVHAEHHFKGFSIYPLQNALAEESLRRAMNAFTQRRLGITLRRDEALSAAYRQSTPAFVLTLHRVRAVSHDDAVLYALTHAEQIAIILGIERGQKPSAFGFLTQQGPIVQHAYIYPGYRGNLLAPMLNEFVDLQIENLLPKLRSSSWARLLTGNYTEATAERDHGFQYLRFWSLLELIAAKHVTSDRQNIFRPDGSLVLWPSGQPVFTRGSRAKVYSHLTAIGTPASNETFADGTQVHFEGSQPAPAGSAEIVSLWEHLGAIYAIRNSIAHTGQFIPDAAATPGTDEARAARFYASESLYRNLRELARMAMHRELEAIPVVR
jgi:hypothetical protein